MTWISSGSFFLSFLYMTRSNREIQRQVCSLRHDGVRLYIWSLMTRMTILRSPHLPAVSTALSVHLCSSMGYFETGYPDN